MIDNRKIYPSGSRSVVLEFRNKDTVTYAAQVWLDDGDVNSTPQTGYAPFIASPSLFRILSGSGQVMRLAFNQSKNLPSDRESLFCFNFLKIPPANAQNKDGDKSNKMLMYKKQS